MKNYLLRHLQVFFFSLGQLARAPFASLMTVSVIGITLALPVGLYLLMHNLEQVSAGWDSGAQISLFLKRGVSEKSARALAHRIEARKQVRTVRYLSAEDALDEFKRLSGFGEALDALDRNPLPPVLIVTPQADQAQPAALDRLLAELRRYGDVDLAQLDLEWVKRLQVILRLAQRGVWLLATLLGLAVVLTIGNTIRLAILNRRDEIEVIKLIGGTNAFIRRPFLYSGLLQGLLGAAMAWLIVGAGLSLLSGPVADLATLYGSGFRARGLGLQGGLALLGAGAALGWAGSRIAVGRHLRDIEPA